MSTFGENVRRLRQQANLSATELASLAGVSRQQISGWENDKTGLPETPTLFKLAKSLNCSVEDLLAGIDDEYEVLNRKRLAALLATFAHQYAAGEDVPWTESPDPTERKARALFEQLARAIPQLLPLSEDPVLTQHRIEKRLEQGVDAATAPPAADPATLSDEERRLVDEWRATDAIDRDFLLDFLESRRKKKRPPAQTTGGG